LSGLFIANFAVLVLSVLQEVALGVALMTLDWGLVPERMTDALLNGSPRDVGYNVLTLITSTFLHGGLDHFFNNMILLIILGILVEREFGSARFFAIYMASGLAGSLGHYLLHPMNAHPMIGASGAISGIMAAFLIAVFCLGQRVTMLRLFGAVFIVQWLVEQLFSMYMNADAISGVAYTAHVGGFIGGLAISYLFAKPLAKASARNRVDQGSVTDGTGDSQDDSGEKKPEQHRE
jgi:membrane associated rhomboid family serine protease